MQYRRYRKGASLQYNGFIVEPMDALYDEAEIEHELKHMMGVPHWPADCEDYCHQEACRMARQMCATGKGLARRIEFSSDIVLTLKED